MDSLWSDFSSSPHMSLVLLYREFLVGTPLILNGTGALPHVISENLHGSTKNATNKLTTRILSKCSHIAKALCNNSTHAFLCASELLMQADPYYVLDRPVGMTEYVWDHCNIGPRPSSSSAWLFTIPS